MKQRLSEWIKETIEIAEIRIKGHNGNYYHGVRDYLKEIVGAVESLEAASAPWIYIDPADPGTLPPPGEFLAISFRDMDGDCFTMGAYHYHDNEWYYHNDADDIVEIYDGVYAWQPWPEPAPLPGGVQE